MSILREITNDKHRQIENTALIQHMFDGKFTKEEYVSYLFELQQIYAVLESLSEKADLLNDLDGIQRYAKISSDLNELNREYSRPVTESTKKYLNYLLEIFLDPSRKHLLFAHIYVRHMGDMFGGKILSRLVPGSGKAYEFENRAQLVKDFQDKITLDLGPEANRSFDYFIDIFTELWNKKFFITV